MLPKQWLSLLIIFVLGFVCATILFHAPASRTFAADSGNSSADELATMKADIARLKTVVPDQSHAMSDVSAHFSNLWFAGQNDNWPLAQFYSDEAHSHLKWAVRIIPFRKDRQNREVDLGGMLAAFEQTSLKDLDAAIKSKDKQKFTAAYKTQMTNCMACHQACSKEYIRLHIPEQPDSSIVSFQLDESQKH
jgi:hypothetical protein